MSTRTADTTKKGGALACFIVSLGALFYVYEFFIRVTPSAIVSELMRDLKLNADTLGILSASFFYAYTPMQIPAGLLCDRFGPKKVLTISALVCGFSTLCFAHTHHLTIAIITRFCIGMASAFAFVGPLTLTAHWFAAKYFALIAGLIQLLGCVGAIIGGGASCIFEQLHRLACNHGMGRHYWHNFICSFLDFSAQQTWPISEQAGN